MIPARLSSTSAHPRNRPHVASRLAVLAAAGWLAHPGALVIGGAALASVVPLIAMAPEPDAVPKRWQVDIEVGHLRIATVDVPEVGPRPFLYLPYRVINNSGEDLLFAPLWEFSDGEGRIIRSGRDVPAVATSRIVDSLQNAFVQDQIEIIGELLQGEENSKYGVVIWPLTGLRPERMTIYVAGLSGETKTVTSPDGKTQFILRKTLMLDYDTPGNLEGQGSQPIPLRSRSWIMR